MIHDHIWSINNVLFLLLEYVCSISVNEFKTRHPDTKAENSNKIFIKVEMCRSVSSTVR